MSCSAVSFLPSPRCGDDRRCSFSHFSSEDNLHPDPDVNRIPGLFFDYAAAGWQAERVPFHLGTDERNEAERIAWAFYPDGLLREVHDAAGQVSVYRYDLHDNLTFAREARGATRDRPVAHARLLSADYDAADRLAVSRQRRDGDTDWTATVFGYDRDGNLARRVDDATEDLAGNLDVSAGRVHTFAYDTAGWLATHPEGAVHRTLYSLPTLVIRCPHNASCTALEGGW